MNEFANLALGYAAGALSTLSARTETMVRSASIMASFGPGTATPVVRAGIWIATIDPEAARASRPCIVPRKACVGAAPGSVGILSLTGFDNVVEASLTSAMPDWLVAVTTRP